MSKNQFLHQKIFKAISMLLFLISLLIPSQMVAAKPELADPEPSQIITPVGEIKTSSLPDRIPLKWTHVEGVHAYVVMLSGGKLQTVKGIYYPPADLQPGEIFETSIGTNGQSLEFDTQYTIGLNGRSDYWDVGDPNDPYDFVFDTSSKFIFKRDNQTLNGAPAGISPYNITISNPATFTWQADPAATRYWLWVDDLTNGPEWDNQWITAADAGCASGTGNCSYTLPVNLTNGNKQWWILAFNAQGGNSGWSAPIPFVLSDNSSGGGGIPGIGVGISPSGTNQANPVTLTWQADSAAVRYWLWVNHVSNAAIWKEWDNPNITPAEANCASGSGNCSYTLPASLSNGQKEWWILPIGQNNSHSGWSAPLYFSVTDSGSGGGIPGAGVGISPSGTNEANPITLTWQADPAAAHYWLWIEIYGGGEEWSNPNITPSDAGCASGTGTCSYTLPVNLTNGDKVWWVLPTGSQGEATAWSAPLFFSVGGGSGTLPGQGMPISPMNAYVNNPVTFTWQPDALATQYRLILQQQNNTLVDNWITSGDANCSSGTCSHTLSFQLIEGNYTWKILPSNNTGDGQWSANIGFTLSGGSNNQVPGKAIGISPNGTNETNPMTMTWQVEPNAARYRLWIDNLTNGTVALDQWVTASEAGCATQADACTFTSPVTLGDGDFRWWVLAANDLGYGQWSDPLYFTMGGGTVEIPGDAVLLSPHQTTVANPIVFSWRQFPPLPTHVNLSLQPGNIAHRISWDQLNCTQTDDGHECTYTLPYYLSDGDYAWQLQPEINGVYGDLSSSLAFSVRDESYELPGKGVGISPNGTNESNPVTLTWQADPFGARYYLWVNPLDGGEHWKDDTITASQAGCASGTGTCSYDIPITLSSGQYRWWVLPINSQGDYTLWSDPLDFSVGSTLQVPATPIGESPIQMSVDNPAIFFWKQAMNNWPTSFQINITQSASSGAPISQTFSESEAVCSTLENNLALCGYTWPSNLANGEYIWQIKATNSAGSSPMSPNYNFTIDDGSNTLPGKVSLISPVGVTVSSPVTFEWAADPLATHYEIAVEADGGGVFALILTASEANCGSGSGTCSWTDDLAETSYTWTVTAQNANGSGTVSDPASFTVDNGGNQVPGKGVGVSPNGIEVEPPITFIWKSDPAATKYQLWVENGSAYNWNNFLTADEAGCANGEQSCSYTINDQMPDGFYTWYILPANEDHFGTMSDALTFTINTVVVPAAPIAESPSGINITNPVTFDWRHEEAFPQYLENYTISLVDSNKSELIVNVTWEEGNCKSSGTTINCSYPWPNNLADGNYTWKVRADTQDGNSQWSNLLSFSIKGEEKPGASVPTAPNGTVETNPVTFQWTQNTPLPTIFSIEIKDGNGVGETKQIKWSEALCVTIGGPPSCSYTLDTTLGDGTYTWRIRPSLNGTVGEWSTALSFTINDHPVPGKVTLIRPKNVEIKSPVTFEWGADSLATEYTLKLTLENGQTSTTIITAAEAKCTGGANNCTYTKNLTAGNYVWSIIASNAKGDGPASDSAGFTVITSGQLPGRGVGISPVKEQVTNPITFTWQVDPYATSYNLKVTDLHEKVYLDITLEGNDITCMIGAGGTGQCSFTVTEKKFLGGIAYKWQILPINQYGAGEWSLPLAFSVPAVE